MEVRVRFAPSPTGFFNLGNARTALFNWLYAKHVGGKFLLRIEDTDKERSKKEYEKNIIEGLEWLGLEWDKKEFSRQSERLDVYEKYLTKLLKEDKVYYCFCTAEELEFERQAQLTQGLPPKYSGRCRNLGEEEANKRLKSERAVIRLKMPEKTISFNDVVRGRVEFNTALIGDIIIAKNLRDPLYNFSVVVDDHEMKITHVIRGEDHLSNTPKQIALYEIMGFEHPIFAHLPLLLGPDKKKLSKRFADVALMDYKKSGFLADAMVNFLGLLGWHPQEDREVLNREELVAEFELKRVQKGGAVFNPEKLEWLNAHYIKLLKVDELAELLKDYVPKDWSAKKDLFKRIIAVEKDRTRKLSDFKNSAQFFFEVPDYDKKMLAWKNTEGDKIINNLKLVLNVVQGVDDDESFRTNAEREIMLVTNKEGRGEVLWPLRVALSGRENSPGPFEIIQAIGKEETVKRIENAIKKLS
ncbi:MAG: glutamate--tRNA ligase [Patescibacteria group bacterium]